MSFIFWKKTKPITLTFFADERFQYLQKTPPLFSLKDKTPEWWKHIRSGWYDWNEMNNRTSIKQCLGFKQTFSSGFLINLWSDLNLKTSKNSWRYQFSDGTSQLSFHHPEQHQNFYEDFTFFKVNNPWIVHSTEKNLKLAVLNPTLFSLSPQNFTLLQGVVPFVNNFVQLNFFIAVPKREDEQRIFIKYKTPMLHVIPLTDKRIDYKIQYVNAAKIEGLISFSSCPVKFRGNALYNQSLKNDNICD